MLLAADFFMSEICFATFSAFKATFYSMQLEYSKRLLAIQLISADMYCYYDIEAALQLRYYSCST